MQSPPEGRSNLLAHLPAGLLGRPGRKDFLLRSPGLDHPPGNPTRGENGQQIQSYLPPGQCAGHGRMFSRTSKLMMAMSSSAFWSSYDQTMQASIMSVAPMRARRNSNAI